MKRIDPKNRLIICPWCNALVYKNKGGQGYIQIHFPNQCLQKPNGAPEVVEFKSGFCVDEQGFIIRKGKYPKHEDISGDPLYLGLVRSISGVPHRHGSR